MSVPNLEQFAAEVILSWREWCKDEGFDNPSLEEFTMSLGVLEDLLMQNNIIGPDVPKGPEEQASQDETAKEVQQVAEPVQPTPEQPTELDKLKVAEQR